MTHLIANMSCSSFTGALSQPSPIFAGDVRDMSRFAFYAMLLAQAAQYRRLFGERTSKAYEAFLTERLDLGLLHAVGTFAVFFLFEAAADEAAAAQGGRLSGGRPALHLTEAAFYLAGGLLAWTLWDGGLVHRGDDPLFPVWLTMHHVGAFVAYAHQAGSSPVQARHNTLIFGWLWMCHGFGWIERGLNLLLGFAKKKKGEKTVMMTRVREAYALVSVYLMHQYFHGRGQPGLGANYQTAALTVMLVGRYGCNGNGWRVHFIRRVELPGALCVYAFLLTGSAPQAAALAAAAYALLVLRPVALDSLCAPAPKVKLLRRAAAGNDALRFPSLREGGGDYTLLECTRGGGAPLGVAPAHDKAKQWGTWSFFELAAGPPEGAVRVRLDGEFVARDDGRVLCHTDLEAGCGLMVFKGETDEETTGEKAHFFRRFALNDDGTLSPAQAPHLVVGVGRSWRDLTPLQRLRSVFEEL